MYSRKRLSDFAISAATLGERLSNLYQTVPATRADTEAAARRLASWCHSAASGDWTLFARRLQRDGLTMDSIMPRLAAIQLAPRQALPAWVDDAAWIVQAMLDDVTADDVESIRSADVAQPFESLFFGLVAGAERRRDALLPSGALARVQTPVRQAMAHHLLVSVTKLCAMAVYESFAVGRDAWQRQAAAAPAGVGVVSPTHYYDCFLVEMRRSGVRRLFEAKPVLLRLLASLTRQWIEATAEFLRRLDADVDVVRCELLTRAAPSPVSTVEMGLSDLHNFGRSVYIVRFADGGSVVYKPKDLTVDVAWFGLISWLNTRNAPIDLRASRVLPRDGYGWSEFIIHGDCPDREAATRFFRRAGALLCLFHLLVGSDMHEENMIAAGEYPVPIDLEMLLQTSDSGLATGEPALRAVKTAQKKLQDSVLATGLLPGLMRTPDTAMLALGALNEKQSSESWEIAWRQINTDAMVPVQGSRTLRQTVNLPNLYGTAVRITDYRAHLWEGCESYFHFIRGRKSELLADDGPLVTFAAASVRQVLKPTQFYGLLVQRLRNYRDMGDGAMWSAHLDFISRLADWDKDSEALWPLVAAEHGALADLNVPFFVHAANDGCVRDGGGTTTAASGFIPGLDVARQRIAELDEARIAWQLDVVRLTTMTSLSDPVTNAANRELSARPDKSQELDHTMVLDWANRVVERLAARAIREGDGAAWIGLDPLADGGGWQLAVLGNDLYGGAPGVALFLAAHAHVAGVTSSRELALAGLASVRHIINSNRAAHLARVLGIGGASGLGSLIYAFTSIARLLDDKTLIDDAHSVARLLTDDVIASDKVYDVIGGAAGCILGLLKLHRETGDAHVLDRASACGRYLLRHRRKDSDGNTLWRHLSERPLAGFSHGAAGFAYALAALARSSGVEAFAAAARDCLAYEHTLFSPERGNWPDLRKLGTEKETHWPCQWCHGASGIGLARIGMQRFGDTGLDVMPDIKVAVETVRRLRPLSIDTLCCGNLGNAELLAEAADALGQRELAVLASTRLRGVLIAAAKSGAFGWEAGGDDENLGLFRGLAGVGYTLLRRLAPEMVANVLIWE